ncbi:MAG: 3-deoxy-7-phosphoheptulonate synthase [Pseudomonadales bacterium]
MPTPNENLRIRRSRPLLSPAILAEELPVPDSAAALIRTARETVAAILHGQDPRLLVIAGPCSIHDPAAALEYAQRLRALAAPMAKELFVLMRVYFEKPRTHIGWKGLINDPHLDQTFRVNDGLRIARKLLLDVAAEGLPAATEFLDTTLGQYYADLISWGAIGARTTESQIHRQLASGLSMPVGFKNRTDGNVQVAVDAVRAASQEHWFPSLTKEGAPALLQTAGNPDCHVVLRGGAQPNYQRDAIDAALAALSAHGFSTAVVVDCSHGNSSKQPQRQLDVALDVARQRAEDRAAGRAPRVAGIMLESHLLAGNQSIDAKPLVYGQSITDGCVSFEQTATLLQQIQQESQP